MKNLWEMNGKIKEFEGVKLKPKHVRERDLKSVIKSVAEVME